MKSIESKDYWNDILEKFSRHKGTIRSFCYKHGVDIHRLYHRRKKLKNNIKPTFQAINIANRSAEVEKVSNVVNAPTPSAEIRIEIGKAKIYIANTDKISLSNVLKEITLNC